MKATRISTIAAGACTFLFGCTIETNIAITGPDAASESAEDDAGSGPVVRDDAAVSSACTRGAPAPTQLADNVDILFMIDNSGSMAQEQARLTEKLSRLVKALASGDLEAGKENPSTNDYPGRRFTAPRSVHVGIVTSDLGAPPSVTQESAASPACLGNGKNGALQYSGIVAAMDQVDPNTQVVTAPAIPACRQVSLTPPYLEFGAARASAEQLDDALFDFGCVATVGVHGCGIEQPLESVWKALAPASVNDFAGPDVQGQGDGANAGFLRDDSVLAVVMVTDEDDCSVTEQGAVMFERQGPQGTPSVNVRCQLLRDEPGYQAGVQRTSRYVDSLLSLRPGHPERLVFVGLVGLPQTDADYGAFDALLADPRMQNAQSEETAGTNLMSVCGSDQVQDGVPTGGVAYPGRRYVEVAKGIAAAGGNAVLRPICDDDYSDVLDSLAQRIAVQLGSCSE